MSTRTRENAYQSRLLARIRNDIPLGYAYKNESYIQGFPDITVIHGDKYAMLEVKRERGAHLQPNQLYYIEKFNQMAFARLIFPEIEEQVLTEMYEYLGVTK